MSDSHHHEHRNLLSNLASALHLPGFGHSHDHSYTALASDSAFLDSKLGVRTVSLALFILAITTVLQIGIYLVSSSVALLADTIHNLGDALNSIPLLIAFYLARRIATNRYTYGFGRAEDIAGIFIVFSIAFSAGYILWESTQRLVSPQPLSNIIWLTLASIVGFIGNELVATMQIRVGKQIGSSAMIADGQHARVDGLTSLAVLGAVFGTIIGMPIIDPIIGVIISIVIVGITWSTIKAMWHRLMDAVDPHLLHHIEQAIIDTNGVDTIDQLRARWVGHRLFADVIITPDSSVVLADIASLIAHITHNAQKEVPQLRDIVIQIHLH